MKALAVLLLTTSFCFSQMAEPTVDLSIDSENNKVSVTWSDVKISEVKIIFPDQREFVCPTLGETRLYMEGCIRGRYVLELIEDKKTRKTLNITI